jgi:hypothetical protein
MLCHAPRAHHVPDTFTDHPVLRLSVCPSVCLSVCPAQEYVSGDPIYGDMWRWDTEGGDATPSATHDGGAAKEGKSTGPVPAPPVAGAADGTGGIASCGSGSLGGGEVGDGDTDGDALSLHDIPMEEISPEPAGGDFYDSDTESYLSLSVEDGYDTGSVNSAGGSHREHAGGARKYRYRKVLVPSQEQLQSLALLDGENEVAFDLPGCPPPLRTQLFVWPPDARVVIFDIEGAITATAAPKGGLGWGGFLGAARPVAVHDGVVKLLNSIHRNGYRILYIAQTASSSICRGTKSAT